MAVSEIDVDAFAPLVDRGVRIIDVREPDEYVGGHVPGAELIPLGTVAEHLDRFDSDAPTYLICRSGARSMRAAQLAADHGFDVVNIAGGTAAWIASGREVVAGNAPS